MNHEKISPLTPILLFHLIHLEWEFHCNKKSQFSLKSQQNTKKMFQFSTQSSTQKKERREKILRTFIKFPSTNTPPSLTYPPCKKKNKRNKKCFFSLSATQILHDINLICMKLISISSHYHCVCMCVYLCVYM